MVLIPRKRPVKEVVKNWEAKLHLVWAGAGQSWMNDEHTEHYLRTVVGSSGPFQKTLLCWDSFKCHISQNTKKVLKELGIDTAVIPPGCTKFIQPPDTDWNHPFKASIRREYEEWINRKDRPHTAGGNPRAPDIEEYLRWINDAWNALPDEAISKSFKSCGITNAVDGSEDEKIVCFRQAAPMGFEKLRSARQEPDIEMIFAEEEDTDENIINGIDDMEIVDLKYSLNPFYPNFYQCHAQNQTRMRLAVLFEPKSTGAFLNRLPSSKEFHRALSSLKAVFFLGRLP
ncbi:DDE superfamily endonuclease domain-containing protein [Ditylenchus destructor]|uniref:DDE superfamily endonuclease domain-containing protein n=1 Tax=Ditylenchus destructor TaxID=166010 RepID=A0AAD4QYU9_9BILA|nr:DDE superfamily endonuclease domain-containing protein [Ditylenchus destructor]